MASPCPVSLVLSHSSLRCTRESHAHHHSTWHLYVFPNMTSEGPLESLLERTVRTLPQTFAPWSVGPRPLHCKHPRGPSRWTAPPSASLCPPEAAGSDTSCPGNTCLTAHSPTSHRMPTWLSATPRSLPATPNMFPLPHCCSSSLTLGLLPFGMIVQHPYKLPEGNLCSIICVSSSAVSSQGTIIFAWHMADT